jgi:hypothetical protein
MVLGREGKNNIKTTRASTKRTKNREKEKKSNEMN